MIRIALTKGRLEEESVGLFNKSGYDASELADKESKGRKLLFNIKNAGAGIEVVLAKAADVITYVEHGVCDAGIVGKDTIMEHGKSFYEVLDLKFGRCRFALAGLKTKEKDFYSGYSQKIIATKYPNVAKRYFNEKNTDVEIVKIDGSVELAPILGLADGIVDLVETGNTLKENGLVIYEEIAQISARVIVNKAGIKLKKTEIDDFIGRISKNVKNI